MWADKSIYALSVPEKVRKTVRGFKECTYRLRRRSYMKNWEKGEDDVVMLLEQLTWGC